VSLAAAEQRIVLTQDLGFASIVALSGLAHPSVVSLRLADARVPAVNDTLAAFLPGIEADLRSGAIVTIEENRARVRLLPLQ
jgi:predicted nuclease of predicted toxin-antitoxin system